MTGHGGGWCGKSNAADVVNFMAVTAMNRRGVLRVEKTNGARLKGRQEEQ